MNNKNIRESRMILWRVNVPERRRSLMKQIKEKRKGERKREGKGRQRKEKVVC